MVPFKNKEYEKEYQKNYNGVYCQTPRGRFSRYKYDAKRRGFIFKVTLDEFIKITNKPCYYCGRDSYGIDRLNNLIGYIKGNMVSCCTMCNYMKRAYSKDEFIDQCIKITKNIQP